MVQPMALTKYDPSLTKEWGYAWVSEKYDGWRLTLEQGEFYTRSGRILSLPAHFYTEACLFGDLVLDGELWGGYEQIEGEPLIFKVFDILDGSPGASDAVEFEDRLDQLMCIFARVGKDCPHIQMVIHQKVSDLGPDNLQRLLDEVVNRKGEGIVLRHPEGRYVWNDRSTKVLKLKPSDHVELVVMAHHVTAGAREKLKTDPFYVSSLICYTEDGDDLRITWGKRKQRPPAIGSYIRIKYSQYTVGGIPKFPAFVCEVPPEHLDPEQLLQFQRLQSVVTPEEIQVACEEDEPVETEDKITEVLITDYYTSRKMSDSNGYISSLLGYTTDAKGVRIVVSSSRCPAIGSVVRVSYQKLTLKGAPCRPRFLEIIEPEALSSDQLGRFGQLRCLEGITLKSSTKRNTFSLPDNQLTLLQRNPKYIGTFELTEILIDQRSTRKLRLSAGKFLLVKNGANVYKVACSFSGDNVYCSCPSWIFQALPPTKRKCKHCIPFLEDVEGETVEE
jgi:hypothetical protein